MEKTQYLRGKKQNRNLLFVFPAFCPVPSCGIFSSVPYGIGLNIPGMSCPATALPHSSEEVVEGSTMSGWGSFKRQAIIEKKNYCQSFQLFFTSLYSLVGGIIFVLSAAFDSSSHSSAINESMTRETRKCLGRSRSWVTRMELLIKTFGMDSSGHLMHQNVQRILYGSEFY